MRAIRAANAGTNLQGRHAVVVGGTSGIGHGIALRLAEANVGVSLVGRDETRGRAIVEELNMKGTPGAARHEFVRCDAALLGNAARCVADVVARHPTVDMLVLTQGIATTQGYTPTSEGLDVKLALHFYSRMAFIEALLPALRRSPSPRVLSVLSGGVHPAYEGYAKDLTLKDSYTLKNVADATGFYNSLVLDAYSHDPANTNIKFIHANPGFVNTNWGTEMPWYIRMVIRSVQWLGRSAADAGEAMCVPLFSPGAGFVVTDPDGGLSKPTAGHTAEARDFMWAHTQEILRRCGVAPVDGGAAAAGVASGPAFNAGAEELK